MSQAPRRPRSRRIQARVMAVANVPMRLILRLPFPTPMSGRLMLAYITGRKSGRTYQVPLSLVRDNGTLLTPGGGTWTRNLADGQVVRLRLRGRDTTARPELVSDVDEIDRLLTIMMAANPAMARFVRIRRDAAGRADRTALQAAVTHGFRIVRWHLADQAGTAPARGAATASP